MSKLELLSRVETLGSLACCRQKETQVNLKFILVSQVGLSYYADLEFSREQKITLEQNYSL